MKGIFPQAANENLTFDQGQPWSKRGIREHKKGQKKRKNKGKEQGRKRNHLIWLREDKSDCYVGWYYQLSQFIGSNNVLSLPDPQVDCLQVVCLLMPAHYEFFLTTYDNHRKFVFQSSVLFRKVLWLDCILPGCCTLLPSCYNLLLHGYDLHQIFSQIVSAFSSGSLAWLYSFRL